MTRNYWLVGIKENDEVFNFLPVRVKIGDKENSFPKLSGQRIIAIPLVVVSEKRAPKYILNIWEKNNYVFDENGKVENIDAIDFFKNCAALDKLDFGLTVSEKSKKTVKALHPRIKLTTSQRKNIIEYLNKRCKGIWNRTPDKIKTQL